MEKREKFSNKLLMILFILFLIWILLQFLAPFSLPQGSIDDLSGVIGVEDNKKSIDNIILPWSSIYSAGDRLCHQKSERSFYLNGNQMPFCSRCTGIWLGLAIGLGFMFFYKVELDNKFVYAIIIGLAPIGIDGFGQLFGFWESTNIIRLITGLLSGGICGISIGVIIDEFKELKIKNIFSKPE